MSFLRVLLAVASVILAFGSFLCAINVPTHHWQAATILLWVALGLALVNLLLGELTVTWGRR